MHIAIKYTQTILKSRNKIRLQLVITKKCEFMRRVGGLKSHTATYFACCSAR